MDIPEYDDIKSIDKSKGIYLACFPDRLENLRQGDLIGSVDAEPSFEVISRPANKENRTIETISFVHYEGLLRKVGLELRQVFAERMGRRDGRLFFAKNSYQAVPQIDKNQIDKDSFFYSVTDGNLYLAQTRISEGTDVFVDSKVMRILKEAAKKFNQPFRGC